LRRDRAIRAPTSSAERHQRPQKTCVNFVWANFEKRRIGATKKCKKFQLGVDMEHNSDKVATAICSEKIHQNN
jgi:hypothetical protein